MSTNTGVAPTWLMASAVAKKVKGVVITSSPGPMPRARRAMTRASVPELQPDGVPGAQVGGGLLFEGLHLGAQDEVAGFAAPAGRRVLSSSQRASIWGCEIEDGDRGVRCSCFLLAHHALGVLQVALAIAGGGPAGGVEGRRSPRSHM